MRSGRHFLPMWTREHNLPIEVVGIEEIKARLDRLSNPKTKLAMERVGCRAAAKVLVAAQQQTVPFLTGKLEGSLGIQVQKKGDNILVRIGPDKRWNYIGRFHEFGTKFMTGNHWMQKAFDSSAQQALDAYVAAVKKMFDKHEYDGLIAAIELATNANAGEE